jgi:N6-L-threonylcarbamoyladenine synthase
MLGREELHFSFAGLKTAVRRLAESLAPLQEQDVADIAASFEVAVTECVTDRCARALELARREPHFPRRFVVAGGVAANARLRARLQELAARHDFSFHAPPVALCSDNAAMIAWAGAERLALGQSDPLDAPVRPRWPLDAGAQPAIGAGVKA